MGVLFIELLLYDVLPVRLKRGTSLSLIVFATASSLQQLVYGGYFLAAASSCFFPLYQYVVQPVFAGVENSGSNQRVFCQFLGQAAGSIRRNVIFYCQNLFGSRR